MNLSCPFVLQVIMGFHIMGDFGSQHIGLSRQYFEERDCWIDCREPGLITIDPKANIGWRVSIICVSHDTQPGYFGRLTKRPTIIEKDAFICANVTLYNCTIGEGAIVAIGSVVRSMIVPPWTMVEGNPAVPIKKYNHDTKQWERIPKE